MTKVYFWLTFLIVLIEVRAVPLRIYAHVDLQNTNPQLAQYITNLITSAVDFFAQALSVPDSTPTHIQWVGSPVDANFPGPVPNILLQGIGGYHYFHYFTDILAPAEAGIALIDSGRPIIGYSTVLNVFSFPSSQQSQHWTDESNLNTILAMITDSLTPIVSNGAELSQGRIHPFYLSSKIYDWLQGYFWNGLSIPEWAPSGLLLSSTQFRPDPDYFPFDVSGLNFNTATSEDSYSTLNAVILDSIGTFTSVNYKMFDSNMFWGKGQGYSVFSSPLYALRGTIIPTLATGQWICDSQYNGVMTPPSIPIFLPQNACDNKQVASLMPTVFPNAQLGTFGASNGTNKCFMTTFSPVGTPAISNPNCFVQQCQPLTPGSTLYKVQIRIQGQFYYCYAQGDKIAIPHYNGYLLCPDPADFCPKVQPLTCPRGCYGHGTCQNGACICSPGWTGDRCHLSLAVQNLLNTGHN